MFGRKFGDGLVGGADLGEVETEVVNKADGPKADMGEGVRGVVGGEKR